MDEDSQGYLDARVASAWPWREQQELKKVAWLDKVV